MPLLKTEGIIIRSRDLGESDRIVTIYTKEAGKLSAVARGARRPRNRFASLCQVLSHGSFGIFESRGLGTVNQGELITSFKNIRGDLTRTAYALFFAELFDEMVEEGEVNLDLYLLLLSSLHMLNESKVDDLGKVSVAFQLKFLAILGYRLELDRCSLCGGPAETQTLISSHSGGLLCAKCKATGDSGIFQVSPGMVQIMKRMAQSDYRLLSSLRVQPRDLESVRRIVRDCVDYRLSRPLKSAEFLESMIYQE